jgi:predicted porin
MWRSSKRPLALILATTAVVLVSAQSAQAEVKLAEADKWVISTDGRVNGFVSHVWGDDRPEGLENLGWVGFNESGDSGQADAEGKLRKTRIRSGYVPSTLAFNLKKQLASGLNFSGRVEIGFQIANRDPTFVADPTWMEPRAVYLDIAGFWGSVRAGRDLGLFSRGNLIMNYELGHAYGVGFPCAYELVFGGACGHVGFGTLWPDFKAQITYTTPSIGDVFELSLGIFDPRTVPTYSWTQTPLPRFEGEAVAHHNFSEGWGFKAWGNGAAQQVGIGVDRRDPTTMAVIGREDFTQTAWGVGGGAVGYLGPVKAGVSGYAGRGMDGFQFLTFNPIFVGQAPNAVVPPEKRRFRPSRGILAEASVTIGTTWVMGGFGMAMFDRIPTDYPITAVDVLPLLSEQRGISAGLFHRIENVVIGLDYFNAHYGFEPRLVEADDGTQAYVNVQQTVHTVNSGATLEW